MNVRSLLFVGVAAILAVVLAVMARSVLMGNSARPAKALGAVSSDAKVLVAAAPMPIGHIVTPESVRWQSWPNKAVQENYYVDGKATVESIVGKVVRYSITPGQVVTAQALVGQGERGFLAAVLTPGMRAVTVSINDTSGVAGFVFPGDRVDLVLSHDVDMGDGPDRIVSETVLTNVRVLAVGQNTNDQGKEPMKSVKNVTLEVTPKLVEKIAVMERIGSLSLSLRALAGGNAAMTDDPAMPLDSEHTFTVDKEVTKFLNRGGGGRSSGDGGAAPVAALGGGDAAPQRPRGPTVMVARGSDLKEVEVGGAR